MDYFLAVFHAQTPTPDPAHVRDVVLLPLREAVAALTFAGARRVLLQADAALRGMRRA